jgi:hypothetical protein
MVLLEKSAKGILFVVGDTLGTLLGVHAGSALGFYRKNDGHLGFPIIYQVEAETPIKWEETKLLVILIRDEKTQVSMLLPQWSYCLEPADKDILLVVSVSWKISFWVPESKDFHRGMKWIVHFNREINEELYGVKNARALDICFGSSEAPPCLRALWDCLESRK